MMAISNEKKSVVNRFVKKNNTLIMSFTITILSQILF